MEFNVAQYGNCYSFNSKYNLQDDILYRIEGKKHVDTGQRRLSSLTGPSFGLNLIVALEQIDYMKGGITKQVKSISLIINAMGEIFFSQKVLKMLLMRFINYRLV